MKPVLAALLAVAGLSLARKASAEPFSYTDRSGHVHRVDPTPLFPARAPSPGARSTVPSDEVLTPSAQPPETAGTASSLDAPLPVFAPAPSPKRLPVTPPVAPFEPPSQAPFHALIQEAATLYSLPVELVLAVIKVESNFNVQAVSRKGARGLMQLMPGTAADLGVTDAFDPRQNIFAGTRYLRWLVNEFDGHVALAVAAYNAGAGAVRRAGGIPPNPETVAYVPAVLAAYQGYQASATRTAQEASSW